MTFVCLWTPGWSTGVDFPADLAPALLSVAPRVMAERRGVVWADARGLPAREVAEALLLVLAGQDAGGDGQGRAGIALTPVAAEVAARWCEGPVSEVRPGGDGDFLAPFPIAALDPPKTLRPLLDAIGVETCRDLARLDHDAVEVRLGADGVRLWRLARADDRRPIFAPMPRALPTASLDWVDYVLRDSERLLFVINALAESVCEALDGRGLGAREITLLFSLANRETLAHPLRLARPTASRAAVMRRVRTALERLTLPDAVTGITLRVDSAAGRGDRQGDLFDRGFGTARAAEEVLGRLVDDQGPIVVVPENSEHPLLDRRTAWRSEEPSAVVGRGLAPRSGGGARVAPTPRLVLYLLPEPRQVVVATEARRDHQVPVRYEDGGAWHPIVSAAGPDRVSGGQWEQSYAREYFRCVTDEGALVWLFRDGRGGEWYLHGWWD
jgi:protein ImuB